MKKSFLLSGALLLSISAFTANAQQLPNVGFESWKTTCGKTTTTKDNASFVRPGVEPADWNGSNVTQVFKFKDFVKKDEASHTGGFATILTNQKPGLGKASAPAPAFLNFGTPWIFADTGKIQGNGLEMGDGGVYGGMNFSHRPDAVVGWYKRDNSKGTEDAYVIAYLWSGTFKSQVRSAIEKTGGTSSNPIYSESATIELTDVDRAILGKSSVAQSGTLIASCEEKISNSFSEWTQIIVPLEYKTTTVVPEKMNLIISAADYWNRANIVPYNTLVVDDVDFVYYSTLTSLKAGSKTIALKDGVYNYTVAGKMPTEKEVVATCKSQFADAAVAVDAANYKVTVTVTNQGGKDVDGATQHVYTLQYTAPVAKQYAGILNVDCDILGGDVIANATQEVTISYYNDNTCDFSLPDFMFEGNNIGNIEIPNVKVSEDAAGTKTFTDGEVEAMKLAEGGIVAHVVLNGGTITAAGVINMPITVGWMPGYPDDKEEKPINVLFSSDKKVEVTEAGYYYVVKGDDYQHPLVEHQTTMLKSVKYGDMNGFTYTLSLDGVNAGGINFGDMAVAGLDNTDEQYSGTDSAVALGNGKTASVTVDGGKNATTGKYEVKFATTVDGQLYNIVFTTDDSSLSVNDVEASGAAVRGAEGAIVVEGFAGRVNVYTVDGRLAASAQIDGEATITVAAGLYVVRAGEKAVKVVVK
jgi:hypothetical protein